ncbi:hypothetical protein [Wolbachia endosymbiont (group A) of Volucella inflata]|uniref:hypothetical protein n=1 Tax=Wolbachia endosymbiont (group A) of Volucella inflata TaxID=2954065 RepID=UPI0022268F04|nr:hypothetical protein [Wolbachia endosymbiont (group A) of Volucella inflata]
MCCIQRSYNCVHDAGIHLFFFWIPVSSTGMTKEGSGMTEESSGVKEEGSGMTEESSGMTENFVRDLL